MKRRSRSHRLGGFTLIEVLVALVVVAFGVGALMSTLTSAADNTSHLRDKTFAEWIALNHISELRLGKASANTGDSSGDVEFAGQRWRWRTVIRDIKYGLLQIEVTVSRGTEDDAPALATAWGFIGTAIGPAANLDPSWSPANAGYPGGVPPGGVPPGSAPP
jgi:type II secretion system protein I